MEFLFVYYFFFPFTSQYERIYFFLLIWGHIKFMLYRRTLFGFRCYMRVQFPISLSLLVKTLLQWQITMRNHFTEQFEINSQRKKKKNDKNETLNEFNLATLPASYNVGFVFRPMSNTTRFDFHACEFEHKDYTYATRSQ